MKKAKTADSSLPDVGAILKRLRAQRGVSVREVSKGSDLSESFLHAVERGESDISLGRLSRLASCLELDLGSLLGFTSQLSRPNFVTARDRVLIDRGNGIHYESIRLPGLNFELDVVRLAPRSEMTEALAHEGVDVLYIISGEVVLMVNGIDYPMKAGECCIYSAGYAHKLRNDTRRIASIISFTTGRMY